MNPKMSDAGDLEVFDRMHPDDVRAQQEAEVAADAAIDAWFDAHRDEIKATIRTYPDADGEEKWWALRELFWGSSPIGSDSLRRRR